MRTRNMLLAAAVTSLLASTAMAREYTDSTAKDAWLDGKLETAYLFNPHLSAFAIDTDVKGGVAYLSGKVESSIDKSLAEEIAMGIDGIHDVKSTLVVDKNPPRREVHARVDAKGVEDKRTFREWFDDVTTTASVKSKLVGNPSTSAIKIDVDTRNNVVTLSGKVASSEEKDLAGQVAKNVAGVKDVHNQLTVG